MLNVLNLLKYQLSVCVTGAHNEHERYFDPFFWGILHLDPPLDRNVSQMIISVQLNCSMLISLSMNKGPFTLNKNRTRK